jgi:hypothetical protein
MKQGTRQIQSLAASMQPCYGGVLAASSGVARHKNKKIIGLCGAVNSTHRIKQRIGVFAPVCMSRYQELAAGTASAVPQEASRTRSHLYFQLILPEILQRKYIT